MSRRPFGLVLLAAAVWVASRPADADACAIAMRFPPPGIEGPRVETAAEAAYIVWDEQTKTEHFIRRATFAGTGTDFGFLVPTPGRPQLGSVDDALFDKLAAATAPAVVHREEVREVVKPYRFDGCIGTNANSTFSFVGSAIKPPGAGGGSGGEVQVLEQKRVGSYDATVLTFRREPGEAAATGAAGLAKWLADHGYQSSPALQAWLEWYVEHEWCMTAFKIAPGAGRARGELRAEPVRLSFKTERPFYPYREPDAGGSAGAPAPRLLRVFFASSARFVGQLGDGAKLWPGRTVWSGPVEPLAQSRLFAAADLPKQPVPDGWWLTEFEDRSSPRPGTDEVFFERSADQTPVARPVHVVTKTREVEITPWWHAAVPYGVPLAFIATFVLLRRAGAARPA